ncbi:MAG: response regulator transcription factor [Bryobacteraceae bacterium]
MSRVLAVIDDAELRASLGVTLPHEEFTIEFEQDGLVGLNRALDEPFDVVVAEAALPGFDGFELVRQLRKESPVPVLLLAAEDDASDAIRGLRLGADDCLGTHVSPEELLARLRAVRRRFASPLQRAAESLRVGELSLIPGARKACLGVSELRLTVTECKILEQLMRAAGRPVSRDQLCLLLYKRPALPSDRSIDTHIARIRHKMGAEGNMILSVRGTGYQLRIPTPQEGNPSGAAVTILHKTTATPGGEHIVQ